MFLRELWRSLARFGVTGRGVWASIALAYFVYGMTLPTMFNTEVLYLSAAVAVRHAVGRRAAEERTAVAALHSRPATA